MKFKQAYYHNEIELIRIEDPSLKNKIEKVFLRNRISYFIRWDRPTFFQKLMGKREGHSCKICINEWDKEKALELIGEFDTAIVGRGEILLKRTASLLPDLYVHKK